MAAREVALMNDRDLARERLPIFAGMDQPSTIVRKELIDNEIDVVNERGQKATECYIAIGPNRLKVMDNGTGISTKIKEGTDKTHLWIACAKMFSSSNYSGVSESVGANGVGMTIANYTSRRFAIAVFGKRSVEGYQFVDGFMAGTYEMRQALKEPANSWYNSEDIQLANSEGDFVTNPLSIEEGHKRFKPFYETGFMVDVMWRPGPNNIFPDEVNIDWLIKYTKLRAGELASGNVYMKVYSDDDFSDDHLVRSYHWSKNKDSENYVKSWKERAQEHGATLIKQGPWTFAFSKDSSMKIDSLVQGAPIQSRYTYGFSIDIQDYSVTVHVPVSICYVSTEYPKYQDQTKTSIRYPYYDVKIAFEKSGEVYKYFYREAEKAYMAKVIKDSDSNMFWPALGDPSKSELIIAEGYSAISGLKSQRDPMTQACIALRGKILNTWNLDMQRAMRADVVKQILNAVIYTPYKRIIIATDEDYDGHHIAALLLALFARFTNLIQEGKVFRVHSPLFLFKARGKETLFSDKESDKPAGYVSHRNKGLGSMTAEEVSRFIMNSETRELIPIIWDEEADFNLDHAFSYGGENWIID